MIDIRNLSINERVAYCRKLSGFSQIKLAKSLDMKPNTYSTMERSGTFSAVKIVEIAQILGISPNLLFLGIEQDEPVVVLHESFKEANKKVAQPEFAGFDYNPIEYTRKEEQHFRIVHNLPNKYKQEVFDFIQEKYLQSKYKKK